VGAGVPKKDGLDKCDLRLKTPSLLLCFAILHVCCSPPSKLIPISSFRLFSVLVERYANSGVLLV
jgi:hypothetical protein